MKLIDYVLSGVSVSNPDGTMPTTAINCTVVKGPGNTSSGTYANALDLGTNGRLQITLDPDKITTKRFFVRCVFRIDTAVTERQNLVESNCFPFSMIIDKGSGSSDFKVVVFVNSNNPKDWTSTTTEFFKDLKTGTWYTADLVYDIDTLAVYIDGVIVSVRAYSYGHLDKIASNQLFIGSWVDQKGYHFNGQIAAVQVFIDEIPSKLEQQLDERRSSAEWFITYKQESSRNVIDLGLPQGRSVYNNVAMAHVQMFDAGLIMYNESVGAAFEMHGPIFLYYQKMADKAELGYLVSNEGNTLKPGGRKVLFSKGGIYWSAKTGAIHVSGQMYLDYEQFGESSFIGWPVAAASNISNGKEQIFQGARMYYKNDGAKAFEVHGAILEKFLSSGGVNTWGYPVCNQSDIRNETSLPGKYSEFEHCIIYWSADTGAFALHGDIRLKYKDLKGPIGQLGFPTSDENNIPGASGPARYNTFQNGSILWFGNSNNMFVCQPFTIFLGRIDSQEDEGKGQIQNDLYLYTTLEDNGQQIYNRRYPESGDYGDHNVYDVNAHLTSVIVPNSADRNIKFTVDIWDSDKGAPFGGDDDHLGFYTRTLSMSNAWGMAENNGIINTGSFDKINNIAWSVQPVVKTNLLTPVQRWWGVSNTGTPAISYAQYAAAFKNVDSETEWWDVTDWLQKAFYELVIKGLASKGNCFGMSLEAIKAYKGNSPFSLPLDRFTDWNTVVNEFNIKHQHQAGASCIWWFVGQFLSGNTHNPIDVFNETRNEYLRGSDPVVCIAQNWDFSGAPHCILPVGWDSSTKPWKMSICDPIFPGQLRTLLVDPDKNEFTYDGNKKYSGAEWKGGRFYYFPYSITNERPLTPLWDAIVQLLAGTMIILGSDTETISLVDENGSDLDAFGEDSLNLLKQGRPLNNKFVSIKGFDAFTKQKGVIASEVYMRSEKESQFVKTGSFSGVNLAGLTLGDIVHERAANNLSAIKSHTAQFDHLRDRSLNHIINDVNLRSALNPAISAALDNIAKASAIGKKFNHKVRGVTTGQLVYAVKNKLNEFRLQAPVKTGEANNVETTNIGTSSSVVKMISTENKTVMVEINHKMGVDRDNLKIIIDKIPIAVGKDLDLSIKPGLAGLDILTTTERVNASISIQATLSGQVFKRNYRVDIEGGIRIRPSTVLSSNELRVGKIDNLFGQMRDSSMILGS